jgi:N-acetylglucosamine-6-phosphate deacetylase
MSGLLVRGAHIVTPDGVLDDGWLLAGDRIEALGIGAPPDAEAKVVDLAGDWLVPGFVDVHCHGGGGRSLYAGAQDDVRVAAGVHRGAGTTTLLASIGSMPLPRMLEAARAIAAVIDDGSAPQLAGIHFEGPFLSRARRGAHPPSALRDPEETVFAHLLEAAGGYTRLVTIAPELPGALELISRHDEVRFALGHTDADGDAFAAGIDAGARHVTHLYNAMPPLEHRRPGPVARALLDERVSVELIVDGIHLAPDAVRLAIRAAGPERVTFVTDASAAAGLGDGHYDVAGREIDVVDGAARLTGTTTLAGSTLTLAAAVERAVSQLGVPIPDAVRMASTTPADRMGWTDRGRLVAGARAHLLALDARGRLLRVLAAG